MMTRTLRDLYEERAQLDEAIRNSRTLVHAFKQEMPSSGTLELILGEYTILHKLESMKEKIETQIEIAKQGEIIC